MRLNLDVDQMRDCMALWRDAVMLRPAQNDGATRAERARVLANLEATMGDWLDLLRLCTVDADSGARLNEIKGEVAQFRAWSHRPRRRCS